MSIGHRNPTKPIWGSSRVSRYPEGCVGIDASRSNEVPLCVRESQLRVWYKIASLVGKRIVSRSFYPIVSFTFDDAPVSSFKSGGKVLEEYGFRGTYYISAGLMKKFSDVGEIADFDTIREFHGRGHEIGNHTYEHLDCRRIGPMAIVNSIRRNRRRLSEFMSGSFAYPYGSKDARAYVAARMCTTSARGILQGINRDVIDVMDLKSVRIYNRNGVNTCMQFISECATSGGWLIFYTHDVSPQPTEYGCTPAQLSVLARAVRDKQIQVAPVGRALEAIRRLSGGNSIDCL
jgi:peptidoglycan/xylan/chitin deacetylase (PgdA/CDA1 family)